MRRDGVSEEAKEWEGWREERIRGEAVERGEIDGKEEVCVCVCVREK